MIRLHTSPTAFEIHNLFNVLSAREIRCEVRGEFRRAAVGELPANECWVELWLLDDEKETEAREILAAAIETTPTDWTCGGCGERIEGQFGQCWNCQRERDAIPESR